MRTVPTFCGKDCGGNACPLLATVDNGRVTRLVNSPAGGKYLKGCVRGFALPLEIFAENSGNHLRSAVIVPANMYNWHSR